MCYAFDLQTYYRVEATDEEASQETGANEMAVSGRLELTILDRRDAQILAEFIVPKLRISSAGSSAPADDPEAARMLAVAGQRLLVRFGTDGKLLGYGFPDGMRAEQRNLMRSILGAFAFTVPVDAGKSWETEEFDVTGCFLVRYRRLVQSDETLLAVRREKLRYTEMGEQEGGVPTHRLEGFAQADLSENIGWIAAASIDEGYEMDLAGLPMRVLVHVKGMLELRDTETVVVTSDEIDWATVSAPAGGHLEDSSEMAQASERESWLARLRGVTLQELLDELTALLGAEKYDSQEAFDAVSKLVWLARLQPEIAEQIEQVLVTGGLRDDVAHWVLTAMANAGTVEAQHVLTSLYENLGLSESLRQSVALSMFDVSKPRPELLAAVAAKLTGMSGGGALEEASLLAFGVLAPRQSAAVLGGRTAMEMLLGMEGRAKRNGSVRLWLEALGNSGSPEIFARVRRYLSDPEVGLRESAVSALRDVDTPGATKALAETALRDASTCVRTRAVDALARRTDPNVAAVLRRIVQKDADPGVQRAAVMALSRHPSKATKRLLTNLAETSKSADLRALARQILGSKS